MNTALCQALAPPSAIGARSGAAVTRELDYRWHLRQVMAARGMFATTDLIGPLAERGIRFSSSSQVYRSVTERPERLSPKALALLDILDCSMTELIGRWPPQHRQPTGPAGRRRHRSLGSDLRPKPARIT
ncbi:helix-turn-helix transcriptional regulator [Pseudonocardia sp. MCCB 268]|nr:helix-turn-helix transcriptional regulator [Pseudonocardia cytotoxica]